MRSSILIFLISCSVIGLARDKDTVPLKDKVSAPVPPTQQPSNDVAGVPAQPYIASIEAYGSSRINERVIRQTLGEEFEEWLKRGLAGDPASPQLEAKLVKKLKDKFGFASADWTIVQYFQPGDLAIHMTLDVVEKEDVAKRLPFLPKPAEEFKDPDNLIKQWFEYEDTALSLVESGGLEPDTVECLAFHCPFGHKHEKLKKYEKIFVEGVKKNEKALIEIQTKDKRADFRAGACYLLAYLTDGKKVVSLMVDRIKDPDEMVRNNALRVLGDISEFHAELIIPARPVIEAFKFPRVSDRSKATYIAYMLASNSQEARTEIMKSAIPDLLQILSSKQPDHRDTAHAILRKVSGKDFSATDVRSWKKWHAKLTESDLVRKSTVGP